MEPARATWTDERLDDLATRIDHGFTGLGSDMDKLRSDMDKRFERVDRDIRDLRAEVKSGDEALRTEMSMRFEGLERTVHWFGGGMLLTFLAGFVTLLLAHA